MVAVVAIAGLLLGFGKAGVAGTIGPFVTVLLALALPADDALGLLLPMLIFADGFAVAAYWRRWERALLPPLLIAAAGGVVVGTWVLASVSEEWLQRIIALAMLLFAFGYVAGRRLVIPEHRRTPWGMAAGSVAGFTSTVAHAGGPPVVAYLLTTRLEPVRFVGTTVAFFAALNLIKIPGYVVAGLFDRELIVATLWGWLLIPVGIAIGRLLVDRIPRLWFERVTLALLVLGSLVLLAT